MAKPYIPLTQEEQQTKANNIARKKCPKCECDMDYETGCKKCVWYLLMNQMIGEEEF
jgi:hypothetical protein